MKKQTLLIVIFLAAVLLAVNHWYVWPALEQYNMDVQAYHERNLLPE